MSQDLLNANITLPVVSGGTLASAGTWFVPIMAIPGTAYGGGITLVSVKFASNVAIAAGSAPSFELITQSSTGAILATVVANGSAALSAGTPVAGTIATEWIPGTVGLLGVKYGHAVYGAATPVYLTAAIQYYHGRGSA